ncbi:MAG: hypothetical protein V3V78_04210 [Candidatus Woesearchaeota archaeon]
MKRIAFCDKYLPGNYIRKDSPSQRKRLQHNLEIIESLQQIGEVVIYPNLNAKKIIIDCYEKGEYSILITHIPYCNLSIEGPADYDDDLYKIKLIHEEFPLMKIIAYTEGKDVFSDERLKENGVNHVLWRDNDVQTNLEKIVRLVK